ncbi:lysylphosphatidylglycerol synthase transmembrane domain-containing protein [Calidifontibacillus oryziterrae]|uniref:lysylphosphatidylglycerol synthase transmembrane domain-containing protein n=1 Tax=Calidifontibacillus oryziterrae TaxID=1191699 RepID=UPI0002D5A108|nr:lysylphosphatidylglycerol synthase transmembrane domain-containing protein [Calidifontibacillus oryziterrae]
MSFSKRGTQYLRLLVRLLISAALIIWLGFTIDWSQLGTVLKESSLLFIILALVAIQLTVLPSIWKWKLLVDASVVEQGSDSVSLGRLGRLYYIGLFFNNFLPSSVGGDVIRIIQLGRTIGMPTATASVGFERFTSGLALVMILLGSVMITERARPFLGSIVLLCLVFVLIFFILWYLMIQSKKNRGSVDLNRTFSNVFLKIMDKLKASLLKIGETTGQYSNKGSKWWLLVAVLSFAFQIGMVWINDLLFKSLHVEVPFLELLVIITLISALTMLPISINGIGVREVSYIFFFQQLGIPNEIAVSVSLLFFLLVTISSLAGGVFWLYERDMR